jgi:hypothetical protein
MDNLAEHLAKFNPADKHYFGRHFAIEDITTVCIS